MIGRIRIARACGNGNDSKENQAARMTHHAVEDSHVEDTSVVVRQLDVGRPHAVPSGEQGGYRWVDDSRQQDVCTLAEFAAVRSLGGRRGEGVLRALILQKRLRIISSEIHLGVRILGPVRVLGSHRAEEESPVARIIIPPVESGGERRVLWAWQKLGLLLARLQKSRFRAEVLRRGQR